MANLRDFRHRVSVLKKQGLVNVDARSALPNSKVKGKRLDTLIEKYDAVASGKASAVKVPPAQLKRYRKAGYETAAGRVLVPHSATETVKLEEGNIVVKSKSGMERVQIPCEYKNLEQYLDCIKKHAKKINAMKGHNEYFGFKFFGNNSTVFYRNIQDAIDDLRSYQSVLSASSRVKQQKIYRNIELFRLTPKAAQQWEERSAERRRTMSKEYNKKAASKFRSKLKRKPKHIQERYRRNTAEAMKRYRARLKRNKKAYAEYKKDARLRAKKSEKKLKTKKRKIAKRKK